MMPVTQTPWTIPADWPVPTDAARALSERLVDYIRAEIESSDGSISFARYMALALYAPGLGYYSAGAHKIGAQGDFVTAPEISPLFARCIARSCESVFDQIGEGDIVELGAGTGTLAAELLRELNARGRLPRRYRILEPSADLRERQQQHLQTTVPDCYARVEWLDAPPAKAWRGLLLANEVLDALPVDMFGWSSDAVINYGVGWSGEGFVWAQRPADAALAAVVERYATNYSWAAGYRSEINVTLASWLNTVTENLQAGAALFIDYGYARHDYYRAERAQGTLLCHYRHRAHADPFLLPGLQDITAQVDFTAVAEAAVAASLSVSGFTTQAHFLLDNGIEQMLADNQPGMTANYLQQAAQAKTLLLPGEMGERFKALLLLRDVQGGISGFGGRDLRNRL
jgi:SAM-dependent MidA family methyltransferase